MAQKSFKDTFLRGIALLGLIVVLVLGAWGIILLAFNLPSFLGGVSDSVSGLFTRGEESEEDETEEEEEVEEPETPVVVTPTRPTTPTAPSQPGQPVSPSQGGPTYVYTPASVPAVQLYGLPDLRTSIVSVTPSGNRYVMQFVVENVGTNTAYAGWNFNAILPINSRYTYVAPGQRALNPGDRIVYTLTFDRSTYGYNYPYNYDYDDRYYDDERYDDCNKNYQRWDLDEWKDWYEDVFDRDADSRDDWDEYDWETWYEDFCDDRDDDHYDYDYNYGYPYYQYPTGGRSVTIVIDPQNRVYEQNEYNNSTTWNLNVW
jgi:hypothetical protein